MSSGRVAIGKCTPLDQRVGCGDELVAGRRREHGRVVADADAHVLARRRAARAHDLDQVEFHRTVCVIEGCWRTRSISRATPGAPRVELGRAPLGRELVEHAVDVGVAVLGAEALGDFDRLVDDDAIRHVEAMAQLVGADAQHRALDRIDAVDLAIEVRRERRIELGAMLLDAAHEILEVVEVGDFHVLLVAELVDHARDRVAADLPGVHGLQRAAARARSRGGIDAGGCVHRASLIADVVGCGRQSCAH